MKSEERRAKSEEFDSPSKEENSCLGKRLYEPSAKFENSTFKTLIAPAIHSPPSLDLWSLARARRGGASRFSGAGVGLPITPTNHSPPSLDLWSLARARRGGASREAARVWGFQ